MKREVRKSDAERDVDRFEKLVRQAYRVSGGRGPEWQAAHWMAREILRSGTAKEVLSVLSDHEMRYLELLASCLWNRTTAEHDRKQRAEDRAARAEDRARRQREP